MSSRDFVMPLMRRLLFASSENAAVVHDAAIKLGMLFFLFGLGLVLLVIVVALVSKLGAVLNDEPEDKARRPRQADLARRATEG